MPKGSRLGCFVSVGRCHGFQHVFTGVIVLALWKLGMPFCGILKRPGLRIGRGLIASAMAVFDFLPFGIDLRDEAFVRWRQVVQRKLREAGQRRIERVGGFTGRRPDLEACRHRIGASWAAAWHCPPNIELATAAVTPKQRRDQRNRVVSSWPLALGQSSVSVDHPWDEKLPV